MCKFLNFIFSWGFFVFMIALGVALWFVIDYLEPFRLDSALVDFSVIVMMACVFGIIFYAVISLFIVPFKARFKCQNAA